MSILNVGGTEAWMANTIQIGGQQNLTQIIKSLFANSEVGFAYDPNDLTTLYQDAAGTSAISASMQPLGLVLDKSKGLILGEEKFIEADVTISGEAQKIDANTYRIYSSAGAPSGLQLVGKLTSGRMYVVEYTIDSFTIIGDGVTAESISGTGVPYKTTGKKRVVITPLSTTFFLKRNGIVDAIVRDISVKELLGNHAYQATSSMRPLLLNSPRKIDYDAVDDKLVTNLPAQLTGCTVIRAVPNVGTQILTNQTIPTPYNDSTDHCGLIVINRALTATETAQITRLFNKASGV